MREEHVRRGGERVNKWPGADGERPARLREAAVSSLTPHTGGLLYLLCQYTLIIQHIILTNTITRDGVMMQIIKANPLL